MKIDAKGIDEMQAFLLSLAEKESKKILRAATKDALKPVLLIEQGKVPVKSGKLLRSLKIKAGGGRKGKGYISAQVRTDSKSLFVGDRFYAGMQNFGYEQVPYRVEGKKIYSEPRGSTPTIHHEGKHFAEQALEEGSSAAIEAFAASIAKRIQKLKAKGAK